jgi:hypothetical protein
MVSSTATYFQRLSAGAVAPIFTLEPAASVVWLVSSLQVPPVEVSAPLVEENTAGPQRAAGGPA